MNFFGKPHTPFVWRAIDILIAEALFAVGKFYFILNVIHSLLSRSEAFSVSN